MTPAAIISGAAEEGIALTLTPTHTIRASGNRAAINRWTTTIRENTAAIVATLDAARLLQPAGRAPRDSESWRAFFDERARYAEFEAGLPRAKARARAFSCCLIEWLNRDVVTSLPGRCFACTRRAELETLVPFGIGPRDHVWLHSRCWAAWHENRLSGTVVALAALGIEDVRE